MASDTSSNLVREKLINPQEVGFGDQLTKLIFPAVVEVVGKRRVKLSQILWEHPLRQAQGKLDHGDYSTNLALQIFSQSGKKLKEINSPLDLANAIVNAWRSQGLPEFIAKVEVASPGFTNVWLKNEVLISQLEKVLREKDGFGRLTVMKGKKILLEHTSPNPQTTIMLGHLRNNFLGMAISNLWEFMGAQVTKDCIVNDRGVHLCRAIWGYLVFGRKRGGLKKDELLNFKKVTDAKVKEVLRSLREWPDGLSRSGRMEMRAAAGVWSSLLKQWTQNKSNWWRPQELGLKPDHANLIWYVLGSKAYKLSKKVKNQVEEILLSWEKEDKFVRQVWRQLLDWSAKGYAETYQRVGSHHDWSWHESDHWLEGKKIVQEGLEKKVFQESEGAVVSNLADYGLSDTIVQKADGTALYLTQDLALTRLKRKKFPSNLYVWDIGNEQNLYMKQLFAICEQLKIGKLDDYFHLNYSLINYKGGGKMATRTGNVVMADEILDELKAKAEKIIKGSNQELRGKLTQKQLNELAEAVALGAIKYSLLKYGRETTIQFDIDESLALEGNSGPYLQYTYARTQSVLVKAEEKKTPGVSDSTPGVSKTKITPGGPPNQRTGVGEAKSDLADAFPRGGGIEIEELSILRVLYQFPEIIQEAGEKIAPNLICNYLYDLAQKFNYFYHKCSILKASHPDQIQSRLALTAATAQVLKNGLNLLGIETPERM
ncbi:arginine--tRNA ligase [Patescibacteria group bacterium]